MKPNLKLKALFADVLYDVLLNTSDYDEELIEIYEDWFDDDEPEILTWERISDDIEDHINTYILGDTFKEEE